MCASRSLALRGLAVVLLLAFTAPVRHACSGADPTTLRRPLVRHHDRRDRGGTVGFSEDDSFGALTPSGDFTYNGATVGVYKLSYEPDYDELVMEFEGDLAGSDYTLQLGELSFPLSDPDSDTFLIFPLPISTGPTARP